MGKLGLAIMIVNEGARTHNINEGEWSKKVRDLRSDLKFIDGLQLTDIASFISFTDNGCFLVQVMPLGGRTGDHLSSWIYIPNNIDISDEETLEAYNFVRNNIMLKSNISNTIQEIEAFFSQEYPTKEFVLPTTASSTEYTYAYRMYADDKELKLLIGKYRYQKYYDAYKAIYLFPDGAQERWLTEARQKFKELTQAIIKTIVLRPIEESKLREHGIDSVKMDGQPFNKKCLIQIGTEVTLQFERKNCEPLVFPHTISDENGLIEIERFQFNWKKRITITVLDERHQSIGDCHITINGISGTAIVLPENKCHEINVKVTHNMYEKKEAIYDASRKNEITIVLTRKTITMTRKIELRNNIKAEMTIKSREVNNEEEIIKNIKGYKLRHGVLCYQTPWKYLFIGAGAMLATLLLLSGGLYLGYYITEWLNPKPYRHIESQRNTPQSTTTDDTKTIPIQGNNERKEKTGKTESTSSQGKNEENKEVTQKDTSAVNETPAKANTKPAVETDASTASEKTKDEKQDKAKKTATTANTAAEDKGKQAVAETGSEPDTTKTKATNN